MRHYDIVVKIKDKEAQMPFFEDAERADEARRAAAFKKGEQRKRYAKIAAMIVAIVLAIGAIVIVFWR